MFSVPIKKGVRRGILILLTADEVTQLTAYVVAERLHAKPDLVLGYTAGRTMERLFTATPTTKEQNVETFGGKLSEVPKRAFAMGVGIILEAKKTFLIVTGERKGNILAEATEGLITAMISATALQPHPNRKVIVNETAAERLRGRD